MRYRIIRTVPPTYDVGMSILIPGLGRLRYQTSLLTMEWDHSLLFNNLDGRGCSACLKLELSQPFLAPVEFPPNYYQYLSYKNGQVDEVYQGENEGDCLNLKGEELLIPLQIRDCFSHFSRIGSGSSMGGTYNPNKGSLLIEVEIIPEKYDAASFLHLVGEIMNSYS